MFPMGEKEQLLHRDDLQDEGKKEYRSPILRQIGHAYLQVGSCFSQSRFTRALHHSQSGTVHRRDFLSN